MDILSNLLQLLPVRGHINCHYAMRGEWSVRSPETHEALFHLIAAGQVFVSHEGVTHQMEPGDMVVFPRGDPHVLSSQEGLPVTSLEDLHRRLSVSLAGDGRVCDAFDLAGTGPASSIICGRFSVGRPGTDHLMSHVPSRLVLRGSGEVGAPWLSDVIRRIAAEVRSEKPGAHAALDGLLRILFVQAVRGWLETRQDGDLDWLHGLQDAHVSRALSLLHDRPEQPWTVQALAREVGMSRSNFAARFKSLVGEPPLRYLARWRLVLAAQYLEDAPHRSVAEIAQSVGYDSEASFSLAFKRRFGKPPGVWRRASGQTDVGAAGLKRA